MVLKEKQYQEYNTAYPVFPRDNSYYLYSYHINLGTVLIPLFYDKSTLNDMCWHLPTLPLLFLPIFYNKVIFLVLLLVSTVLFKNLLEFPFFFFLIYIISVVSLDALCFKLKMLVPLLHFFLPVSCLTFSRSSFIFFTSSIIVFTFWFKRKIENRRH